MLQFNRDSVSCLPWCIGFPGSSLEGAFYSYPTSGGRRFYDHKSCYASVCRGVKRSKDTSSTIMARLRSWELSDNYLFQQLPQLFGAGIPRAHGLLGRHHGADTPSLAILGGTEHLPRFLWVCWQHLNTEEQTQDEYLGQN